jgi:hypothetical protein
VRELGGGGRGASGGASINGLTVKLGSLKEVVAPLIRTVDANAFEVFGRADSRRKVCHVLCLLLLVITS